MRDAFADALIGLMRADDRIVVLDGDVANSTKLDRVFHMLPDRFIECGIAEQNMVGVAAGLAAAGYRPVVVTFAAFAVSRVLDQVRMMVAQTGLPVTIVGAYAGILAGKTGKTHISVDDLAVYRALPQMQVLAPGDGNEVRQALEKALGTSGPTYLRVARDPVPVVTNATSERFTPIQALASGGDVQIVSTGTQTVRCLAAVDRLAALGIVAGLIHIPQLKPVDTSVLRKLLGDAPLVVSVEEHNVIGGLGSLVAEVRSERPTTGSHLRLGILDRFAESGPDDALLDAYGLSVSRVTSAIHDRWRRLNTTDATRDTCPTP